MFLLIKLISLNYNSDDYIYGKLGEYESEIRDLTLVKTFPTTPDQDSMQKYPVLSESFESKQSRKKQQNTKGYESKNIINNHNSLKNDEININKLLEQLIQKQIKDKKQKNMMNRRKNNKSIKNIDVDDFFSEINNDQYEEDEYKPSEMNPYSNQAENESLIDELHEYQQMYEIYNNKADEEPISTSEETNSDEIIEPEAEAIIENEMNQVELIPQGFEQDVRAVVCSSNATVIINNDGELKFWFNYPFKPESVQIFENYYSGKVSLSNRFLCAINDTKELSCYRVTATKSKLTKLYIPSILVEDTIEVSAGNNQICAISKEHQAICWAYHDKGGKMMYVPKNLRKNQAKQISTMYKKHCGIDLAARLTCWGKYDGRQFKEEFEDAAVAAVSVGQEYICWIGRQGRLECMDTLRAGRVGVPSNFKTGTLQVSVSRQHVCAISRRHKVKCWDYKQGKMKVPLGVKKEEFVEVSAGQYHNCAISKRGRLSCWLVEGL
eukprot:Mrub_03097.p1 GENE.Mrub_03097~~Mrub_03097.p1  ORF type:complete len:495 (+),score=125.07 Mrub_03097:1-1485(+)